MLCPKCKREIPEKSLKCDFCNARIATLCKKCNSYNPIYNLKCSNCNNELLKICPSCKSINIPNASKCRKCGLFLKRGEKPIQTKEDLAQNLQQGRQETTEQNEFKNAGADFGVGSGAGADAGAGVVAGANVGVDSVAGEGVGIGADAQVGAGSDVEINAEAHVQAETESEAEEPVEINYTTTFHPQHEAKEILKQALLSDNKKIISLNGAKGVGKTIVLKSAINEIEKDEKIWLIGECSPITQLSPYGLIQDILLTFFNIPDFCIDNLKLKKESQKFFQHEFPILTNEEIFNLLNFLYPTNSDYFENILYNKEKTFTFLRKVFQTIIEANRTVIIVENFDYIDGLSYEFLHNLINSQFAASQLKFVVTYNQTRPVQGLFYNEKLKSSAYFDISISPLTKEQVNSYIERYLNDGNCPGKIKHKIWDLSGGNPAIAEQYLGLVSDFKILYNSYEIEIPSTLNEVLSKRLNLLMQNPNAYKTLLIAAAQGIKFSPAITNQILQLDENTFLQILTLLQNLNFIVPVNANSYAFKNTLLWSELLEILKPEDAFTTFNSALFKIYSNYILSSYSILAIIAQNINENSTALNLWTNNIKLASYLGDTNLYAISQKQCLVLLEKVKAENELLIKNNIYERLGKLLSKSNPQEAMEYLPNAIKNANANGNVLKEIELTGYLAQCCGVLGNYFGAIECTDAVIERIDVEFELEIAMLKSRKLSPLLNIGNSGEIIQLADNDILPVFDKYLNAKLHKNISREALYKAWLQTYLNLATALIYQGNNRSFEVLTTLFDLLQKNEMTDELFICKTKLALAFANCMKGDIEASEKILEEIIKTYRTDIMDNESISRWNLINILNNIFQKNYSGLKEELFQVVSFANNINDNFTKNILKTLLGKILKDEQNAKQANEIYSQQITYFSKEKNAIGALLSWYLISEAKLITSGPAQALEVAQKALEVAKSPKINNYFFIVLYCKIIAEAHIVQGDYEMAKIAIEKGILVARKFELLNLLADLYLLYGKYLQDLALIKTDAQKEYIVGSTKMYKKALLISQGINNQYLISASEKAKTVLNSFCQLNGIILHGE